MTVTLMAVFAVVALLAVVIEQRGCSALYRWLSEERRWRHASGEPLDPRPNGPTSSTV
jgi:hypothetical protein